MILGLRPGDQVAFEVDGEQLAGRFVRIGGRAEQVDRPGLAGTARVDAAIVELEDGATVATAWCDLELPGNAKRPPAEAEGR